MVFLNEFSARIAEDSIPDQKNIWSLGHWTKMDVGKITDVSNLLQAQQLKERTIPPNMKRYCNMPFSDLLAFETMSMAQIPDAEYYYNDRMCVSFQTGDHTKKVLTTSNIPLRPELGYGEFIINPELQREGNIPVILVPTAFAQKLRLFGQEIDEKHGSIAAIYTSKSEFNKPQEVVMRVREDIDTIQASKDFLTAGDFGPEGFVLYSLEPIQSTE